MLITLMVKSEKFECTNCGYSLTVHPPDDYNLYSKFDEDGTIKPIEMNIECENCGKQITVFWSKKAVT